MANSSWNGRNRRTLFSGPRPPLALDWIGHWLTPAEFAAQMGRSYSWAVHAASTGMLDDFNIPHMRDNNGRIWIKLVVDCT